MNAITVRAYKPWLRLIVDHNPFYILSGLCMLLGCYQLNYGLQIRPSEIRKVLLLLSTINIYELMLIGLGLYLILRRGLYRDGGILLVLEALFLVDVTFLNQEIFTAKAAVGAIISFILLIAAIGKVDWVMHALRFHHAGRMAAIVVLQIAILLAMPGVFRRISSAHNGMLSLGAIYAAWWVIAIVPVAYLMLRPGPRERRIEHPMQKVILPVLLALPMVSLIAHLSLANWVYRVPFYVFNCAPMVLAMAICAGRVPGIGYRLRMALPALAVMLSVSFPPEAVGLWHMSPLRLILIGAVIAYGDGFRIFGQLPMAYMGAACVLGAMLGESVGAMIGNMIAAARWTLALARKLTPKGPVQWGLVAIGASFLLLGIGALVSMLKKPVPECEEEAPEPTVA